MPETTIVDRVRLVLGQTGKSQASFASAVGMTEDKLSKSLSGVRRFTSLELALVAEVGGVTVDWLLSGKTPERPLVAARAMETVTVGAAPVAELVDRHVAAFDVLDLLGEVPPAREIPPIAGDLDLWRQGEVLAQEAWRALSRGGLAVHQLDLPGLATAVEQVFGTDVVVGRLPDGLDGLAWQREGRRLIFLPSTRLWTRQRFSLAHELGHILFGDAQQVLIDQDLAPGKERHPTEKRANSFAAAFLMPEQEIRNSISGGVEQQQFAELVVRFQVSPSAMAARLRSLGFLKGAAFEAMWTMTSVACHELAGDIDDYLMQVGHSMAARLPSRLVKALFGAYQEGRITLRPLANLLDTDVDELYEYLSGAPETGGGSEYML